MFTKHRSKILAALLVAWIGVASRADTMYRDLQYLQKMHAKRVVPAKTMSTYAFTPKAISEMVTSGLITAQQAALVKNDLFLVAQIVAISAEAAALGVKDTERLQTELAKRTAGLPSMLWLPMVSRTYERVLADAIGMLDAAKHLGVRQTLRGEAELEVIGSPISLRDPAVIERIKTDGLATVLADELRESLDIPSSAMPGASAQDLAGGAARIDRLGGDHTNPGHWNAIKEWGTGKRPVGDFTAGGNTPPGQSGKKPGVGNGGSTPAGSSSSNNGGAGGRNSGSDIWVPGASGGQAPSGGQGSSDSSGSSGGATSDDDSAADDDSEDGDGPAGLDFDETDGSAGEGSNDDGWTDAEPADDFYGSDGSDGELTEEEREFLDEVDKDNQTNNNGEDNAGNDGTDDGDSDDDNDSDDDSDGDDSGDDDDDDDDDKSDSSSAVGYTPSDEPRGGGVWVSVIFVSGLGNDDGFALITVGVGEGTSTTQPTDDGYARGSGSGATGRVRVPVIVGCPLIDPVRSKPDELAPPEDYNSRNGGTTDPTDE